MKRRNVRLSAALALPIAAVLVAHFVAGMSQGIAMLAPALAILLTLLTGRYVGEQTIDRVRRTRPAPPRRRRDRPAAIGHAAPRLVPRGGLLVAASLATRPPPLTV